VLDLSQWPLWLNITVFLAAAGAIALAGTKLAQTADAFADRTGLGEAIVGALLLGIITSLPGITASVTAALDGRPSLAVSNALGGIAAQTTFLAIADIFYRKANLEHAAASAANLLQVALLVTVLGLAMVTMTGPSVSVGPIHPGTPLLILAYLGGFWVVWRVQNNPQWRPKSTEKTVADEPEPDNTDAALLPMILKLLGGAVVVFVAGVLIAKTGGNLADQTGISESVVGGLFTAVATSLPELVTTIAAVRAGALSLAVGNIAGGNAFDVLFLCVADIAYLPGSIYHAAGPGELFIVSLAIVLNGVLLMGMVARQRQGPGRIGVEGLLILLIYAGGFGTVVFLL
jgi:cation:H+ antiporter